MNSKVKPLGDFLRNLLVLKIRSRTDLFIFQSMEVAVHGGDIWGNCSHLVIMRRVAKGGEWQK